eukprot:5134875-Prymnesium_polylepis.1
MRINDTLAAMLSTDVLIGVHGAGISNAAFLRPGAIVIEMFPRTFVEAASWGRMQHSYVARLGVNHVPLLVNETHPHCISRQMDGPGLVEHWRDCDVVVDWETILAYVQMASKAGGLAARMAMLKRSVAAMQMGTRLLDTHKSKHVQLIQSGRAGIARGASLSTPLLSALVAVGLVLHTACRIKMHTSRRSNDLYWMLWPMRCVSPDTAPGAGSRFAYRGIVQRALQLQRSDKRVTQFAFPHARVHQGPRKNAIFFAPIVTC